MLTRAHERRGLYQATPGCPGHQRGPRPHRVRLRCKVRKQELPTGRRHTTQQSGLQPNTHTDPRPGARRTRDCSHVRAPGAQSRLSSHRRPRRGMGTWLSSVVPLLKVTSAANVRVSGVSDQGRGEGCEVGAAGEPRRGSRVHFRSWSRSLCSQPHVLWGFGVRRPLREQVQGKPARRLRAGGTEGLLPGSTGLAGSLWGRSLRGARWAQAPGA